MKFNLFMYLLYNNYDCGFHYLTKYNLTIKIINNYKIILLSLKILPVDIINSIINVYIDNRIICQLCDFKFNNLKYCIKNKDAVKCNICEKYTCYNCTINDLCFNCCDDDDYNYYNDNNYDYNDDNNSDDSNDSDDNNIDDSNDRDDNDDKSIKNNL